MTIRCTKISMKRNFILLLLCFVASIGRSEKYYYEFTSNPFGTVNTNYTKVQKTAKLSDVTWTLYSSYIQGTTNYLQVSTADHADDEVTLVSESSFKAYANYKNFWIYSNDKGQGNPNI